MAGIEAEYGDSEYSFERTFDEKYQRLVIGLFLFTRFRQVYLIVGNGYQQKEDRETEGVGIEIDGQECGHRLCRHHARGSDTYTFL